MRKKIKNKIKQLHQSIKNSSCNIKKAVARCQELTVKNCIGATGRTLRSSSLKRSRVATVRRCEY